MNKRSKACTDSQRVRSIEDYATIEGYCEKIPLYAFGYTYVWGISPTFITNPLWQKGNKSKATKFVPKKSWEITNSIIGSTPPREPKTAANDDQPLLCGHLIDGDPETCWASRTQIKPDVEDVWIRIDLPVESRVNSIYLIPAKKGMRGVPEVTMGLPVGKSFPKNITIQVSRDAWHWETVYENCNLAAPANDEPLRIDFDTRNIKQIKITGHECRFMLNFGYCFSLAQIKVNDEDGNNLALHSRGAGVTVSSTHMGYGMDRFTQDMLWPVQYDLGFKWTRVGYDMSAFQWAYIEREKGKLKVDPKSEAAVTEAIENGLETIMVVDEGNWLHAPGDHLSRPDPCRLVDLRDGTEPGRTRDLRLSQSRRENVLTANRFESVRTEKSVFAAEAGQPA